MQFKFARYTTTTGLPGNPSQIYVEEGDAWDSEDPLVKARPDLFSDTPPMVHSTFGKRKVEVEQATAAPGEKRKR